VSIKPNRSDTIATGFRVNPSGRVEWTNTTLRGLLRMAYQRFGFDPREIVGGPAWVDSDRFDVIATTERPPQIRPDGFPGELLAMIRALVEDRFKAKVHNEQRDGAIYALVLVRSDNRTGSTLRAVPDACAEAMKAMAERATRTGRPPCSFGTAVGKLIRDGCDSDDDCERAVELRRKARGGIAPSWWAASISNSPSILPRRRRHQPGRSRAPRRRMTRPVNRHRTAGTARVEAGIHERAVDVLVVDSAEPPSEN
jgi:hypothetical protein